MLWPDTGLPGRGIAALQVFKISLWKSRTNQHKISLLCTFVQHILDFLFWAISQFQFSRHLSLLFLCNSWFSIKSCAALAFCPVAHPSVFCSVRALPRPDLAPRTGTFGAACFFWAALRCLRHAGGRFRRRALSTKLRPKLISARSVSVFRRCF